MHRRCVRRRIRSATAVTPSLSCAVVTFLPIATDRLVLRRFRGDAPRFAAYRSDPDVARYQSWDRTVPAGAAERLIDAQSPLDGPDAGEWIQIADRARRRARRRCRGWVERRRRSSRRSGTRSRRRIKAVGWRPRRSAPSSTGCSTSSPCIASRRRSTPATSPRRASSSGSVSCTRARRVASVLHHGDWADDARYALTADGHRAWWRGRPGRRSTSDWWRSPDNRPRRAALSTHRRSAASSPRWPLVRRRAAPGVDDGAPVVPWVRAIEADGELVGFMMLAERTGHIPRRSCGGCSSTGAISGAASESAR